MTKQMRNFNPQIPQGGKIRRKCFDLKGRKGRGNQFLCLLY